MGSLIAGVVGAVGLPRGLAGDGTPSVPSAPVKIGGTSGLRPRVSEVGSWQVLIMMFVVLIVLGAAVLMFAAWQRTRVLARRRVRRMAEAVAPPAVSESLSEPGEAAAGPALAPGRNPPAPGHTTPAPHRTAPRATSGTPRATPGPASRPPANA